MKIAVERQSGPFMMVRTTCSIQLSPLIIENRLCWLFTSFGSTIEKFGRWPAFASEMTRRESTILERSRVLMQSANVGQIAHPYGTLVTLELTGSELAYSLQLN